MKINHVRQQQRETSLKNVIDKSFADIKEVMDKIQLNEDNKENDDLEVYASRYVDQLQRLQAVLGKHSVSNAFARYLETSMETEMHERLYAMEQHYAKKQTN